ncbi:hypothetical protein LK09_12380 [Microbacterium mangrovi]|uniref:Uncharacterized protein n=1 Tax=Microbacterium mangrovi TaxID=1348253 RepID=A0A0B2A204_9MICO|nr:DUF2017 family protein [Microbacterium mangrovi]KHK97529.1 hypothetical protein LK09_12380 [Microbacterium mangrovi]
MNPESVVLLDFSRAETAHLSVIVRDFIELLDDSPADDPALARLVPSAYPDDDDAADEYRALTEADLLDSRRADARTVIDMLGPIDPAVLDSEAAHDVAPIAIDGVRLPAWLRTLAAVRLVLASRLGITSDDDRPVDDPRYGVYEWLAYRLDQLIEAASAQA